MKIMPRVGIVMGSDSDLKVDVYKRQILPTISVFKEN